MHNWIMEIITQSVSLALLQNNYNVPKVKVDLHQVRQISYPELESSNSPEGIHKDGADYIISALVINRFNIIGGKSIIYNNNKDKIYSKILDKNQGIFQNDRELYHTVTPIYSNTNYIGFRDLLGIDIHFIFE